MIVLAIGGHSETGFALPAVMRPQSPHPATADTIRRDHSDGSFESFDRTASARVIELPAGGKFEVRCGTTTLTLTGSAIELTAEATTLISDNVNLGAEGGRHVARVGDDVAQGKIVTGSDKVKAA